MIIVHYGEIGIKGKNRIFFEKNLVRNIEEMLRGVKVKREHGRIIVDNSEKAREILKNIPGIENFSFAIEAGLEIDDLRNKVLEISKKMDFSNFRISTRREDKNFPYTSQELNEILGEEIKNKLGKKVNLKNPELNIFIEICKKKAYIYTEKIKGIGGLPVGSQGKVISLISGGIDSPVASFLMMKRGCKNIFLHFYNENLVAYPKKIEEIAKILSRFQGKSKVYFLPFADIQNEIISNIKASYRMIIYRRAMMKISNEIAKMENAKAIVTGDSIGQVASQTIENLASIYEASSSPVFSPLLGMNKNEIVDLAKKIGTYEISIKEMPDCCSFLVAKNPATKARIEEIKEMEKRLNEKVIEEAIEKAICKNF
ncbi:MAG: tRNA 4-thiouridine(8) synthase ThiI [Thermoplasmatales archaeon]|nr:tRNA 4-thiouridine(8) synthase ThiI [Thermoplasmatales archaeon]